MAVPTGHRPDVRHENLLEELRAGHVAVQRRGIRGLRVLSDELAHEALDLRPRDLVVLAAHAHVAVAVELPEILQELPDRLKRSQHTVET